MAGLVGIKVDGMRKTLKRLEAFPEKVQQRVVRSAVGFALTPVMKQAKRDAPVGEGLTPDGRSRPHLKDTLKKKTKLYKNSGVSVAVVGHDYRKAPHAILVHEGTQPHRIRSKRGGGLNLGLVVVYGTLQHPGAKPDRYLTAALRANHANIRKRFSDKVGRGIEKEAAKAAGA